VSRILIVYPEERWVTPEQLIAWARDDIANGESYLCADQREVQTLEDAIAVLNDSGSVTVSNREEELS
jgi:hypothetical protein